MVSSSSRSPLVLLLVTFFLAQVFPISSFTTRHAITSQRGAVWKRNKSMSSVFVRHPFPKSTSEKIETSICRFAQQDPQQQQQQQQSESIDGTGRGKYLFLASLLVVVWIFSIPVELRRAHWCFSERCEQNPSARLCYDCVSFGEWKRQVGAYYQKGGGVNFDWTVGEDTKALYAGKRY